MSVVRTKRSVMAAKPEPKRPSEERVRNAAALSKQARELAREVKSAERPIAAQAAERAAWREVERAQVDRGKERGRG